MNGEVRLRISIACHGHRRSGAFARRIWKLSMTRERLNPSLARSRVTRRTLPCGRITRFSRRSSAAPRLILARSRLLIQGRKRSRARAGRRSSARHCRGRLRRQSSAAVRRHNPPMLRKSGADATDLADDRAIRGRGQQGAEQEDRDAHRPAITKLPGRRVDAIEHNANSPPHQTPLATR